MAKRTRRSFSPKQKVAILKQHFLDKKPISDLCELHQISPASFYQWQKLFFENGERAFEKTARKPQKAPLQTKVEKLESKIRDKDSVIAEITQEYVQLKKELGEI